MVIETNEVTRDKWIKIRNIIGGVRYSRVVGVFPTISLDTKLDSFNTTFGNTSITKVLEVITQEELKGLIENAIRSEYSNGNTIGTTVSSIVDSFCWEWAHNGNRMEVGVPPDGYNIEWGRVYSKLRRKGI